MRNIAVFTCNRADEGPMGPVKRAIGRHEGLESRRIRPETIDEIAKRKPDFLLVLGDRHELLPACHAALLAQIPIAHIHGGETTLGSFDDRVRNAVSQLATLHFTAAEQFSDKLRAMKVPGEIFTVGPPGLDDLETDEQSEFGSGFFLVCLHPDTTQKDHYNVGMAMAVIDALARFPDRRVVFIEPNRDPGHEVIRSAFANLIDPQFHNLDRRRYLTALKHASVCIGNSSSFVIEAPALGTPTVLVGDRQKGRPLAASIHTVEAMSDDIERLVRASVAMGPGIRAAPLTNLPYGRGGASTKIADILANWSP